MPDNLINQATQMVACNPEGAISFAQNLFTIVGNPAYVSEVCRALSNHEEICQRYPRGYWHKAAAQLYAICWNIADLQKELECFVDLNIEAAISDLENPLFSLNTAIYSNLLADCLEKKGRIPISWANHRLRTVEHRLALISRTAIVNKQNLEQWLSNILRTSDHVEIFGWEIPGLDFANELIRMTLLSIAYKISMIGYRQRMDLLSFLQSVIQSIPDDKVDRLEQDFLVSNQPQTVLRYTPINFLLELLYNHWHQINQEERKFFLDIIKIALVRVSPEAFRTGIYRNGILIDNTLHLIASIVERYFSTDSTPISTKMQLLELNDIVLKYTPEDALDEVTEITGCGPFSFFASAKRFLDNNSFFIEASGTTSSEGKKESLLRRNSLFHQYTNGYEIPYPLPQGIVGLKWSNIPC